jgi:signal transduction histidine kinase
LLPWTVHVTGDELAEIGLSGRAQVVGVAIGLTVLVTVAGAYVIRRALTRELAAARLQSDFVAAVSHEFRTPLTTLRQLSEMLVSGRVSTDAKREQFYQTMRDESERLHRLVEGLLDFGRMEAGALPFHFQLVDATALVRQVVDDFQRRVDGLDYRVELVVPGEEVRVSADREALERVLSNLLDNAVKYSPDARTIWVELTHADGQLVMHVRDRGMGIPPGEQARIFTRFVRGERAKTASIRGTGIGLAMCKQIVDAHHGQIRVDSAEGEGSTFTVSLPQAV